MQKGASHWSLFPYKCICISPFTPNPARCQKLSCQTGYKNCEYPQAYLNNQELSVRTRFFETLTWASVKIKGDKNFANGQLLPL